MSSAAEFALVNLDRSDLEARQRGLAGSRGRAGGDLAVERVGPGPGAANFAMWACRGTGKGCKRNLTRESRKHCDDCLLMRNEETLQPVERATMLPPAARSVTWPISSASTITARRATPEEVDAKVAVKIAITSTWPCSSICS